MSSGSRVTVSLSAATVGGVNGTNGGAVGSKALVADRVMGAEASAAALGATASETSIAGPTKEGPGEGAGADAFIAANGGMASFGGASAGTAGMLAEHSASGIEAALGAAASETSIAGPTKEGPGEGTGVVVLKPANGAR